MKKSCLQTTMKIVPRMNGVATLVKSVMTMKMTTKVLYAMNTCCTVIVIEFQITGA